MEPSVLTALDAYKRRLLDLSRRNRALNFKAVRASTVLVSGEKSESVFHFLVLQGKSMRFRAIGEDSAVELPRVDEDPLLAEDVLDVPALQPAEDTTRHLDDQLDVMAPPAQVEQTLRRLSEASRSSQEEQGVNTLFLALGMVRFTDPESGKEQRSPLVLVPVNLNRRGARAPFSVRATEEVPFLNPALAEWLRREYRCTLPPIPDPLPESFSLEGWMNEVQPLLPSKIKGTVERDEMALSQFAFQKLVMYKDLELWSEQIAAHPILKQLIAREGPSYMGLPSEIRDAPLDTVFPPEKTAQVVDADSSQLRAIAAVAKGYSLVIEGPPGTGKSQTITNLIAQALYDGKTVLFVAEKQAALDVVHRRVTQVGLGEFCLELHATKANRRAVMQSVRNALDLSLSEAPITQDARERLPRVRETLDAYVQALHSPFGKTKFTPYQVFGWLDAVRDAPAVPALESPAAWTRDELREAEVRLDALAGAVEAIGIPSAHPFFGMQAPPVGPLEVETLRTAMLDFLHRIDTIVTHPAWGAAGWNVLPNLRNVSRYRERAALFSRAMGIERDWLRNPSRAKLPEEAHQLLARVQAAEAARDELLHVFRPEFLGTSLAEDFAWMELKEAGFFRFLNPLFGRYRLIRARWWAACVTSGLTVREMLPLVKRVIDLQSEVQALHAQPGERWFGQTWRGGSSSLAHLQARYQWVQAFHACTSPSEVDENTLAQLEIGPVDVSGIEVVLNLATELDQALHRFAHTFDWHPQISLREMPLPHLRARLDAMVAHVDGLPAWAAYERARVEVAETRAQPMLDRIQDGGLAASHFSAALRKRFFLQWVEEAMAERPTLRSFHGMAHEQRIAEFKALDERVLSENRTVLASLLRDRTQTRLTDPELEVELTWLRREMMRQRGHHSVRRTFMEAGNALRAIKPCMLMSPLSVSQFVPADLPPFDLVVFDEASQMTMEDAVGSIARGRQLVVVGDPKQLPPTNFFALASGQQEVERDAFGDPIVEDSESVLEQCMASGIASTSLRWHYRSREEALIAFSNHAFYEQRLFTFPSPFVEAHTRGIQFTPVSGVYQGSGVNRVEARTVAEAVMQHFRETPHWSLGVGTFSMRQQTAIQDELERLRREDPSLETYFNTDRDEPFFVKNLENIQGDERDVILLSVTYGPNADGRILNHFGPLNGENGWRRLNVIATRARERMHIFSSMRWDQISVTGGSGASLLRAFLRYAETGALDVESVRAEGATESPFEAEVLSALQLRGLLLIPQVGVGGYRIDLGVVHPDHPGRFVCGIECDGATYHSSATARDRDRLRQSVLRGRGWKLIRIWSTDWFKDRQGQVERVLRLVEDYRKEAPVSRALPNSSITVEPEPASGSIPQSPPTFRPPPPVAYQNAQVRIPQGVTIDSATLRTRKEAVLAVVREEGPVHESDVVERVCRAFGVQRITAKVRERVEEALKAVSALPEVQREGAFFAIADKPVIARMRSGSANPERISPREFEHAWLEVLEGQGVVPVEDALLAARDRLGFSRTTAPVREALEQALARLQASGRIGQGGSGIAMRSA